MTAQFLKTHKDIGLDVFDQVPEMDVTIGVGQGGGDEDSAVGLIGRIHCVLGCGLG